MRVSIVLAIGLTLIATSVALTLSRSPLTVAADNSAGTETELTGTHENAGVCQEGETVPAGTSAIRLSLLSLLGPRLNLRVLAAGHLLTEGVQRSGWTGKVVTVPVRTVAHAASGAKVCVSFRLKDQLVNLLGERTKTRPAAAHGGREKLPGRIRIEYLRTSGRSWWSQAHSVIRRMGLGHAGPGGWIVVPLLALLATLTALASWLTMRELG